jgi:drug/metabolite transporter (DMT)-like permease
VELKKLRIVLGPFIISWAPIFFVLVKGLSPESVAGWRFLIAGLALALFQRLRGRKLPALDRWMVLGALAFSADIALWHHSILSIGGGLATVLTNTQVLYMSLLSLRDREFAKPSSVLFSATLGLTGVFLLFYDRIFTSGINELPVFERVQGLLFGLIAGMFYTLFLICFAKSQKFDSRTRKSRISALQILTWVSILGGGGLLAMEGLLVAMGKRSSVGWVPTTSPQIFWILVLALIIHIGGWVELGNALNHYKKATMGLILLLQPVMSTVWAWMIFQEKLNSLQLAGAALIFGALTMIRLAEKWAPKSVAA